MTKRIEAGVLAVSLGALAFLLWPVVRDSYAVLDCGNVTGSLSHLYRKYPDLGERLRAVVLGSEGRGHYKPVQDVLYQLAYHHHGPENWTRHVTAIQVFCHLLAALMLHVTVRRMGGSAVVGYFSAMLFALHPTIDEALVCVHFGNQHIPTFFALAACALMWPVRRLSWWRHPLAAVLVFAAGCSNPNWIMTAPLLAGFIAVLGAWKPFSWRHLLVPVALLAVATAGSAGLRHHATGTLGTKQAGYVDRGPPESFEDAAERAIRCGRSIVRSGVLLWPSKTTQDGDLALWDVPPRDTLVRPDIADRRTAGWLFFAVMLAALGVRLAGDRTGGGAALRLAAFALLGGLAQIAPYYFLVENMDRNRYVFPLPAFGAVAVVLALEAIAGAVTRSDRARATVTAFLAAPVIAVFVQIDAASVASISRGARTARSVADQLYAAIENEPGVTRTYVLGLPRRFGRAGYTWVHPGHLRGLVSARRSWAGIPPIRGGDYYVTEELESGKVATPLPATHALFRWRDGVLERLPQDADLTPSGPHGDVLHDELMERWWIKGRPDSLFETRSALQAVRVARSVPRRNPRQIGKLVAAIDRIDSPRPLADFDVERYSGLATPRAWSPALRALAGREVLREGLLLRAAAHAEGSDILRGGVLEAAARMSPAMVRRVEAILARQGRAVANGGGAARDVEIVATLPADQELRRTRELTVVCGVLNRSAGASPPVAVEFRWSREGRPSAAPQRRVLPDRVPAGHGRRSPIHLEAPAEAGMHQLTIAIADGATIASFEMEIAP